MKKLLSLVAAMIIAATTFAQVDEITLTVIGTGSTKEQAVNQALRNAIEQSFGAFVSANTSIVNDKLTNDEIISISSGNIRSYKELGVVQTNNGRWNVSLQTVVSLKKLTTYAKSHGSSCEFAGNTFAQNMKLRELNTINEKKIIENLFVQLDVLSKNMFDVDLKVTSEPRERNKNSYAVPIAISFKSTEISENFYEVFYETLKSIALSENERKSYDNTNSKYYSFKLVSRGIEDYYSKFYLRSPFPCDKLVSILNAQVRNLAIYPTHQNIKQEVIFTEQCYRPSYYDERVYHIVSGWYKSTTKPHISAFDPYSQENIIEIVNWGRFKLASKQNGKKRKANNKKSQWVTSFVGEIVVPKGDISNISGFEVRFEENKSQNSENQHRRH